MKAKLIFKNGRPAIELGDRRLSYAIYSDPPLRDDEDHRFSPSGWKKRQMQFIRNGYHVFSVQPQYTVDGEWGKTRFWTDAEVYPSCSPDQPTFCVDAQATFLREADAEACWFIRFGDNVPKAWAEKYPREVQMGIARNGSVRQTAPSLASEQGLTALCRFIRHLISYCEEQPWAERTIAYHFYPHGEGITQLACEGIFFDHAPVMEEAFCAFLREKYSSESTFQDAWNADGVTFKTARYPTDKEWRDRLAGTATWPEAASWQPVRDYIELATKLHLHWYRTIIQTVQEVIDGRVLFGIDGCKQTMLGWPLKLNFEGRGAGMDSISMHAACGALDVGPLLDEPGLDYLVTPADYTARSAGYGFEPEGLSDSLRLRGKCVLVENDFRTFNPGQEDHTQGAARDTTDMRAMLLRNAAWSLSRGHMDYLMIAGGQYFNHPDVQKHGIAWLRPLLDQAPHLPHRETEHAIALIIDDTSPQWENGTCGFQNLAVLWQRVLGLAHCGIPYRVYLFSDLERPEMPDYRCYLFPNLFQLNPKRLDILHRKVFRDGRMAVFGPATGIVNAQNEHSAGGVSELLGVRMELDEGTPSRRVMLGGNDALIQNLPANLVYGDSLPYGPILIPGRNAVETSGGRVLGWATTYWRINRPGLFMRDAGTHKVAWSVAVPLPAAVLRELARTGGCHVWCEDDHVVLASDTIVALHGAQAGRTMLRLPRSTQVWDIMKKRRLKGERTRIPLVLRGPRTTLYYMGESLPEQKA